VNSDSTKTKNIYVPLACIAFAAILILIEALFISKDASDSTLEGLRIVAVKIILYIVVLLLGMGLCGWLGYPFDPIHSSLLQLLAVTLSVVAVRGTLGILTGDTAATLTSLVFFLVLIGYFFSDEPMNALIAIFLAFTAHSVITFLLMPVLMMYIG